MARERSALPGRWSAWSLRSRLAVLLGTVAVFLVVTLFLQLLFQNRLADERDDLIHRVDRAAAAVSDLRAAMIDQETGVRGYALGAQGLFLEPYQRGQQEAADALGVLDRLLGDSPSADELATVTEQVHAWQDEVAEPAVERASAGEPASEADLEAGQAQFDDLRDSLDDLEASVEAERQVDLDQLDAAFNWVIVMMFVQVGGLIVLGAVIAAALTRQVVTPLARLGDDARQVARGDLSRNVISYGTSPELTQLGEDVEAMRNRIVAELDQLTAAQADLERQRSELIRSNDDLEQFAYVASHDLQEPLRKVSGFCQLLERRYGDQLDDRAKEYIWYANDGARRMQDLINDLLAFSRVGRTTEAFEPVDLGQVTNEVVAMFGEAIEESGAKVTVGDLPTVQGDRRLLAQVVQNLVGNALKFRGEETPEVTITSVTDGDTSTVSLSDNGIGIPPEYADQIFTIFKRLHNKTEYDGTGIGLALSKKIVEYHGGHIWLDTSDTPGTTFCISLPLLQVADAAPMEESDHVDD
jgi:signal transduction histidine kinase